MYTPYGLARVISMVETLDFCPSARSTCSVPMEIFSKVASLTKALRKSSTVSTALLIARPRALIVICLAPELKKVKHART